VLPRIGRWRRVLLRCHLPTTAGQDVDRVLPGGEPDDAQHHDDADNAEPAARCAPAGRDAHAPTRQVEAAAAAAAEAAAARIPAILDIRTALPALPLHRRFSLSAFRKVLTFPKARPPSTLRPVDLTARLVWRQIDPALLPAQCHNRR